MLITDHYWRRKQNKKKHCMVISCIVPNCPLEENIFPHQWRVHNLACWCCCVWLSTMNGSCVPYQTLPINVKDQHETACLSLYMPHPFVMVPPCIKTPVRALLMIPTRWLMVFMKIFASCQLSSGIYEALNSQWHILFLCLNCCVIIP